MKSNGGNDWNDKPYECNAGEPYDHWSELIEDNPDMFKRKWKEHEIKHKTLYFETNDWSERKPCDNYTNSPYSVEDINKKEVAWLQTDEYTIYAGTDYESFIKFIENARRKNLFVKGELNMECSDKEWQHCRVEKMGCEGCIYNEKNADEMFEDLDYVLEVEYDIDELDEIDTEVLILRCIKEEEDKEAYIDFWNDETFAKSVLTNTGEEKTGYITMPELQAIYKKCQELGWIER